MLRETEVVHKPQAAAAVLILGRSRHVVTVVRSMARAGYHVILGREQRKRFSDYSAYVNESWDHPPIRDSEAFLSALRSLAASRPDLSLVFPTGEDALACFAGHPDRLPPSPAVVMAEPDTIRICLNKDRVYELLETLGIPYPRTLVVTNLPELRDAAERIGYPVVVKPPSSLHPFHPKALICHSEEELLDKVPAWPPEQSRLVLQEYAIGLRHGCDLMAVDGEITAYFQFKALRTDWHDGTGMTVSGVSVEPTGYLFEYCRRLIGGLNYSGPAAIQMLLNDATGEITFLEINPRLDASSALAVACGCDFPAMAAAWAEERKRGAPPARFTDRRYAVGVRGVWLTGDLDGLLRAVQERQVGPLSALWWFSCALGAAARAKVHLIFRRDDPLPALYLGVHLLRSIASALRKLNPLSRLTSRARAYSTPE